MFSRVLLLKLLEEMTGVREGWLWGTLVLVLLGGGLLLSRSSPRGGSSLGRGKEPCSGEQPAFCGRARGRQRRRRHLASR